MNIKVETVARPLLPARVLRWKQEKTGRSRAAAYEHSLAVRYCHWLNTISLVILAASGLQIFMAFPSFGPKIPQRDFLHVPAFLALGGWLGGALQWHLTFAWVYIATGILYVGYQIVSRNYRKVLITRRDLGGVWPMAKYYFFRGRKPDALEPYNPLQKLAYTAAILIGMLSVWTGLAIYKPVQLSVLAWPLGGFHFARIWHFTALCLFAAFVIGHLTMVALHGWNNFISMFTGWKRDPEYLAEETSNATPPITEKCGQEAHGGSEPLSDGNPRDGAMKNPSDHSCENSAQERTENSYSSLGKPGAKITRPG